MQYLNDDDFNDLNKLQTNITETWQYGKSKDLRRASRILITMIVF